MRAKRLTLQERREIFRTLVDTQDSNLMSVPESKQHVMDQYSITSHQLEQIVEEGVEKDWPPLNESVQKAG